MTKKEIAVIALIMIIYLLLIRIWMAYEIEENQQKYQSRDSKTLSIDL
jgi:hypothetical protein